MKTKLIATMALLSALTLQVHAQITNEFRGLWVDAFHNGFFNASQVTTLVNHCRTYNFNAVVVELRRRGDAFYIPMAPNQEPRTTAISPSFDALQELLTQCHTGSPKIEVHCWVPTHVIWSDPDNPPPQTNHVLNLHPEYLMQNFAGSNFLAEGYYLDPGNPDAQTWNYNMAKDIVSRYDLDGFHWDYIRYPQQDSGYNAVALTRYNTEFGLNPTNRPASSDTQFSDWRRRQVTDFLRWVNGDLWEIKTNLMISCSVFANRSDAFNNRFQDWATWNSEGIIDICMPMNYTENNTTYNSRVDDAFTHQGVRRVYQGQGSYMNSKENTLTQLLYVRNKPLYGTMMYSYATPDSNSPPQQVTTFTHIRDNFQTNFVPTPSLPWKASPTKGILKGTVTKQQDGSAIYNATVSINSNPVRNVKTEAHGKYVFYETTPASYTVTATAPGLGSLVSNVTVTAGMITNVNFIFPPDSAPPVISNVTTNSVTDSSVIITWTTDENSDSVVEYGTTISYGTSVTNASSVLSHSITLSGLAASTTYHYRVKSKDALNNQAVSADFTFITNPSGVITDVIVESRQAGGALTGNPPYSDASFADSTLKSTATGLTGTGSRYGSSGTPTYSITPTLAMAGGKYNVYLTHGVASSISDNIVVAVGQSGCTGLPGTTTIFREPGGNTWELLGQMTLDQGVTVPTLTFTYSSGTLSGTDRMYSDAIKFVFVPTPPSISGQPSSQVKNYGETVAFSVTANGTPPLSYQWKKGGVNLSNGGRISGATSPTLTITGLLAADTANYTVVITNTAGSVTSSVATLTVFDPAIITQPSSQTNNLGGTAELTVSAVGSPLLSYQWRKDGVDLGDGGNISGSTTPTLTISPLALSNSANYRVVVNNGSGSVTSIVAVLTVVSSPGITSQPQSRTNVAGETATFTVTATGATPLSYQWRTNGVNLSDGGNVSGATTPTLTLSNVGSNDIANYTVVVTNAFGSVTSAPPASLTVILPPVITVQPTNSTNNAGTTATFSVTATDTIPLNYQWKRNGVNLSNGGNVSGATTATLTITSVGQADADIYSVVVSNPAGTVSSNPAELVVNNGTPDELIIRTRTSGGGVTPAPLYQELLGNWQNSATNSQIVTPFYGSRFVTTNSTNGASSFRINPTLAATGGQYLIQYTHTPVNCSTDIVVSVSQSGGTGLSATTTVFQKNIGSNNWTTLGTMTLNGGVNNPVITFTYLSNTLSGVNRFYADAFRFSNVGAIPPQIVSQPASQTNTVGTAATFTVLPSGSGPFSYQWKKDGGNLSNGGNVSGATSRTLTLSNLVLSNAANYTVVVTNSVGSATSAIAVLTVADVPPAIVTQPASRTNNQGTMATFNVGATGTSLTYQWRKNNIDLSDGENISGALTSNLTINAVEPTDAADYKVVITNSAGSVTSVVAVLTVIMPPQISAHPSSLTNNAGQTATFIAAAGGGTPPFTYQWKKNGLNINNNGHVSGATTPTLVVSNVRDADEGDYALQVSNPAGNDISSAATLTVIDPIITSHPASHTNGVATSVALTVGAIGTEALSYQWKKGTNNLTNGGNISGATAATLTLNNLALADAGDYSVVVASEAGGTAASSNATLTVVGELVPPTVKILNPKANLVYTSAMLAINGTASDEMAILGVSYNLNDTGFVPATISFVGAGKPTNWNANITLAPGTNTLVAQAMDTSSNTVTASVTFFYHTASLFTLQTTTDPNTATPVGLFIPTSTTYGVPNDGAMLNVGRTYKVKVTDLAYPFYILTNWTATWDGQPTPVILQTNNSLISFMMRSNMTLNANYITNPLIRYKGTYDGLFYENTIRHESSGFIRFAPTDRFGVSGKLYVDGDSFSVGGKVNLDGTYKKVISRLKRNKPDLLVDLVLDLAGGSDTVTGTISETTPTTTNWTANVLADRYYWSTNEGGIPATQYTNAYTMILQSFTNNADGPTGFSHWSITVSPRGDIATKFAFASDNAKNGARPIATRVSKDGVWPFYIATMYSLRDSYYTNPTTLQISANAQSHGSMIGWLTLLPNTNAFPENTNLAPQGEISWIKKYWTNTTYVSGFTNQAAIMSSRLIVTNAKTTRAFNFTNATVKVEGGALSNPFTNVVFLKTNNAFTVTNKPPVNLFTITATPAVGKIAGKFFCPDTALTVSWSGVMLQDYNFGRGFFLSTNLTDGLSGQVFLDPME